jgi:hypothetical protein
VSHHNVIAACHSFLDEIEEASGVICGCEWEEEREEKRVVYEELTEDGFVAIVNFHLPATDLRVVRNR